jgi:hypothetical protein
MGWDPKAMKPPSGEIEGRKLGPSICVPSERTLTRCVSLVARSWTKTSPTPFVSPGTRLVASEVKATKRPAEEMSG